MTFIASTPTRPHRSVDRHLSAGHVGRLGRFIAPSSATTF